MVKSTEFYRDTSEERVKALKKVFDAFKDYKQVKMCKPEVKEPEIVSKFVASTLNGSTLDSLSQDSLSQAL